MPSVVDICNRGLQKLGADRIVSLTEDSPNARDCNACYETLRDAELRSHPWNFAAKRAQLAADVDEPIFGYSYQYTLPSDFIRLLSHDNQTNDFDYKIEGKKLLIDEGGPLEIRYTYRVTDPNEFDSLFVEMLSCRIALELCEKITQSNQKAQQIREDYRMARAEAKRINAFENVSKEPPEDTWLTARY